MDAVYNMVEWYAGHCLIVNTAVTFILFIIFYLVKAARKEWKFREIALVPIVSLILTITIIPQAFALVLCGFNLLNIEDIPGANVYIFIAAVALVYVSVLAISSFLKD
jgi:hypothetical protein